MMSTMQVNVENIGSYYWTEVFYDGVLALRVGLDHEPTNEEIERMEEEVSAIRTNEVTASGSIDISPIGLVE